MVESSFRATRTSVVLLTAILGLGFGELAAQSQQNSRRPARPQRRMPFDKVIGIIGDQVILQSSIDEELRAIEESGTKMTRSERFDRGMNILRRMAQDEIWVQYGKVISGQSPEEFKAYQDRYVAKKMAEQEQSFGSFTRFNEELGNIGESRGALESQFRNRLLSDLGRQQAFGAPMQRSSLMVTPKAMRSYFEKNPEQFSIPRTADYEWMYFSSDMAELEENMAAAAKAWAKDGTNSEQIATQFGGRLRPPGRVLDDPELDLADSIKNFALSAKPGQVSEPILLGRSYRLYKVTSRSYAREEQFTDAAVQERILRILRESQFIETQNRVIQQNSAKLLIWPPELRNALTRR